MFNTTHTLVGFAMARAGVKRWAPYATWTAVIASNLPDIDIVAQFGGTATYVEQHRGITHAVAAIPFLALLLAFVMHRFSESRCKPATPFWRHFAVALVAMATHPLLDWMNTYGVQPFIPFNATWYYGDALFIIDPYLDLVLLLGVVPRWRPESVARAALVLALIYVGVRLESRELARQKLAAYVLHQPGVRSTAVQPDILNPFIWAGFVATDADVARIWINLRTGETERVSELLKSPASPVTVAAEATRTGKVFQNFARFPVTQVEETNAGYRVMLIDFRFYRLGNMDATALAAEIILDRSLKVAGESMSFAMPLR